MSLLSVIKWCPWGIAESWLWVGAGSEGQWVGKRQQLERLCCVEEGKEWAGWRDTTRWCSSGAGVSGMFPFKQESAGCRCVLKMLTERFVLELQDQLDPPFTLDGNFQQCIASCLWEELMGLCLMIHVARETCVLRTFFILIFY